VAVDLNLSAQLEHNIIVDNLLLCDHLDRHYGFSGPMPRQVHMTVLTFSQMPANLKVLNAPVTWMKNLALRMCVEMGRCVVQGLG
jgi:hypothetical protein